MAKTGKMAWGINVGNCNLKAIKLRSTADGVEVMDFAVIEHEKILSQTDVTPAERHEIINSALTRFLEEHDIRGTNIVVSVPGQSSFARFIKLPPVEKKRIPEIVRFEAIQQIPFEISEVEWDWQLFQSETSPEVEVGIFAVKRELVRTALAPFNQARCPVHSVQMTPMALYNFLNYDHKRLQDVSGKQAVIALDIGTDNTELVISDGRRVWQRTIPIGGGHFTAAIQKAFKLSFAKAEALKRTASTSKYARQIFQAMRSVFADLAAEIQRSLGFYSSGSRDVQFREVLALGNAMKLPGLLKFLQQSLSLPVKRLENFENAQVSSELSPAQFTENLPNLGVVYGLALQGLDLGTIESNLLPREVARQGLWTRKRPWFYAAGLILVAAPLLMLAMAMNNSADIKSDDTKKNIADINNAKKRIDENARYKQQAVGAINAALAKVQKPASLYEPRLLVPKVFQFVRDCAPNPENNPDQASLYQAFAAADFDAVTAIARNQREQVFIESVQIIYTDNIHQPFDAIISAWAATKRRSDISRSTGGGGFPGGMPFGMPFGGPQGMPDMMPGGMPFAPPPTFGGGQQPIHGSSGEQSPGQTFDFSTMKAEPGFVVVIEGTTPHQGGRAFLVGPQVGWEQQDKWGFFKRLRNLGLQPGSPSPDVVPATSPGFPAAVAPSPAQPILASANMAPFEICIEPKAPESLYIDYSEGGWVATGNDASANQPDLSAILLPEGLPHTGSTAVGAAQASRTAMGYTLTAAPTVETLPALIDPFTREPVSKIYKRSDKGEVVRDNIGNPEFINNDYWFRVKLKLKLKPNAPALAGNNPAVGQM